MRGWSWLREAGVWLVAAKLAAVPLVMDPAGADAFTVPKAAMSRGLMYLLIVVGLVYLARSRPLAPVGALQAAMGALLLVAGASTLTALDPYMALHGAQRRHLGLTSIVDGVVLAVAIGLFVRTHGDLRRLAAGGVVGMTGVVAYGIVQMLRLDVIRWAHGSIGSTIGNPTALAGYLAIGTSLAAAALIAFRSSLSKWAARLLLVLIGGAVVVAFGTGSRAPILAFLAATPAIALLAIRGRVALPRLSRRASLVTAAVLAAALAFLATTPTAHRLLALGGGDTSLGERAVIYQVAFRAITERPLLGVGPDGMAAVYLSDRPASTAAMPFLTPTQTSTHSWVLHYALGMGVPGLLAFVALMGLGMLHAWRGLRSGSVAHALGGVGIAAYLGQGLVSINSIPTDVLLWASIGLVSLPMELGREAGERPLRRIHALEAVLALGIGLVLAATTVSALAANRAVHESNLSRAQSQWGRAEGSASVAVARDPGRADHWNVLGLAYSRRTPERAVDAFRRAVEQAPRDPVYRLNLAAEMAFAARGDPAAARDAAAQARRAIELDPNGLVTLRRASEVLPVLGYADEAVDAARRRVELLPQESEGYDWLAQVLADTGRPREAIVELERSIQVGGMRSTPRIDLPKELRLRLSRLYRSIGQLDAARALVRPPALSRADVQCSPRHGTGTPPVGPDRPRCLRVHFSSEEDLSTEGPGSVLDPAHYRINDATLASGAAVAANGHVIEIQLPAGSVPPRADSVVTVSGIANVLGQRMEPDPSGVALP